MGGPLLRLFTRQQLQLMERRIWLLKKEEVLPRLKMLSHNRRFQSYPVLFLLPL
jgi:hypothetical protein